VQFDARLSFDESPAARDHRARASHAQERAHEVSPGSPTGRTAAGGPVPVSRPGQDAARDSTDGDGDQARAHRLQAEEELHRSLGLPAWTRLDIRVDLERDEVRFQIRDRDSGRLIREVPPAESRTLLEKLREFSGVLVDRAL
jgi:uncharacterized FlaG/YvyC family protein